MNSRDASASKNIQTLQVLQSENQIENAATEDVSQNDVDDDVELIENENGCVN